MFKKHQKIYGIGNITRGFNISNVSLTEIHHLEFEDVSIVDSILQPIELISL